MYPLPEQHSRSVGSLQQWLTKGVLCPEKMAVSLRRSMTVCESVFGIGRDYQLINEATKMT